MGRTGSPGIDDGPDQPADPASPLAAGALSGPSLTLADAARAAQGRVVGDGAASFRRISSLRDAGPDDLAFLADRRYAGDLRRCRGRALLVSKALAASQGGPTDRVVVADPHAALVALLPLLHPSPRPRPGVHPTVVADPTAVVAPTASMDAHVVVGAGATIGENARVGAGCVVGDGAVVGPDATLFPNVTLYAGVVLGARVTIHSGTRIGVDGFGYVQSPTGHVKIPQAGECVVEDDVEIGANCTIDRGSIGRTVVGAGAKLDNLVHVAHNVEIGPRSILVAQVGVAGSTRTGEGVSMGGQAGLIGHLKIGAGARIGAQAGVIGDVAEGQTVSGYPARDHKTYLKAMAKLMQLPEFAKRLRRLERRVATTDGRRS